MPPARARGRAVSRQTAGNRRCEPRSRRETSSFPRRSTPWEASRLPPPGRNRTARRRSDRHSAPSATPSSGSRQLWYRGRCYPLFGSGSAGLGKEGHDWTPIIFSEILQSRSRRFTADGGNSCVVFFIRCLQFVVGKVSPQRGFKNSAFLRRRPTAEMTPIMRSVLSVSSARLLPDGYVDDAEIAFLIAVLGKVLPE